MAYTLLILYVQQCAHLRTHTHTAHTYVKTYTICDLRATNLHSVEYIHALYHYIHVLFEVVILSKSKIILKVVHVLRNCLKWFHCSVYVKRNRTDISIHTNRNVTAGRHTMLLSGNNYVRVWTAFTAISTQYHFPNFTLSFLVLSSLPPLFTSLFSHPFPPLSLIPLPSLSPLL